MRVPIFGEVELSGGPTTLPGRNPTTWGRLNSRTLIIFFTNFLQRQENSMTIHVLNARSCLLEYFESQSTAGLRRGVDSVALGVRDSVERGSGGWEWGLEGLRN